MVFFHWFFIWLSSLLFLIFLFLILFLFFIASDFDKISLSILWSAEKWYRLIVNHHFVKYINIVVIFLKALPSRRLFLRTHILLPTLVVLESLKYKQLLQINIYWIYNWVSPQRIVLLLFDLFLYHNLRHNWYHGPISCIYFLSFLFLLFRLLGKASGYHIVCTLQWCKQTGSFLTLNLLNIL